MTEQELSACREALNEAIEREGLDCADNFRFARVGNEDEEFAFNRAIEDGCCGSFNQKLMIGDFEYMIGCNYGH